MIVQCESCQTRFHVADARIPEKGARVRCSRCHHRFHITPSSSAPGAQPSAGEEGSAREPARGEARVEGGRGEAPSQKDDLDNPEFLFDEKSEEDSHPQQAAIEEAAQALRATNAAPPPASHEPGHGLERGAAEERVVASGGKTAQEMLDAGAPDLTSSRFEIGGELGGDDDGRDETGTREFTSDPASRSGMGAKSGAAKPAAAKPVERPARAELDALGKELEEEDESSFAGWDPLTPQDSGAEGGAGGKFFDLASAIAGTPAKAEDAPAGPNSLFDQAETATPAPARKREAPDVPMFDPEAAGPAALILRVAAMLVGIGLLGVAGRALWLRAEADFSPPQVVRADGWVAADLETFLARDALGERVLVVRGNLMPDGPAGRPHVAVRVLGRNGEVLAESSLAWLERIDDAEVAPDALSVRLASASAEVAAIGQQVTGFTAVLPDPPPGARRVEIALQAAPLPPRGTATAEQPAAGRAPAPAPAPAPAQAPSTSLAEPTPDKTPKPAQAPADSDVLPAAPDSID